MLESMLEMLTLIVEITCVKIMLKLSKLGYMLFNVWEVHDSLHNILTLRLSSWHKSHHCSLHSLKVMHLTLCFRMIRGYDIAWEWTLNLESKGFTSWVPIRKRHSIHMIYIKNILARKGRKRKEMIWKSRCGLWCKTGSTSL